MSIKPPSDIVLDVAMAADPAKAAAATRRLAGSGNAPNGAAFAALLGTNGSVTSTSPSATLAALSVRRAGQTINPKGDVAGAVPKAISALETFYLRTAFDTMLPASSHVKGFAGAGAGVWKSMMAEALANQVAASGGLHILGRGDAPNAPSSSSRPRA